MMIHSCRPTHPQPPTSSPSLPPATSTSSVSRSPTLVASQTTSLSRPVKSAAPTAKERNIPAPLKPTTATIPSDIKDAKHAESTIEPSTTINDKSGRATPSSPSEIHPDMGKQILPPSFPSNASDKLTIPPTIPTSPVQIPKQGNRSRQFEAAHFTRRNNSLRRKGSKHAHSPDALSPSVAALLALTDIPRPRQKTRMADKPLTVDEIISNEKQLSEKELSWSLSRGSPMDMLLSPPESFEDDFSNGSDSCSMARTLSVDSMPSLGGSSFTDGISSIDSPRSSILASSRRRMASPIRKSLEPIRSPPDSIDEHPLAPGSQDLDDLDFVAVQTPDMDEESASMLIPFKPLRAVFRSNLTASLRALRSAAKSFSSINFPSILPDDFITRSILTMDPKVPYADERRPPVTEEMPSAELRRYLNPTTRLSHEKLVGALPPQGTFEASIQMQTYKIQRSRPAPTSAPYPTTSPHSPSAASNQPLPAASQDETPPLPVMRQREMRENPDFIRIAVMEMAMRRRGKLDNQKPGRARWALPPRKASAGVYEIGADGVPQRWIPISA